MKKTLLFACAALLTSSLSAQILSEDFEGGALPTGWGSTTSNTGGAGWEFGTTGSLGSQFFPLDGNSTMFAASNDDGCNNCDKSDDFLYTANVDLTGNTGKVYMKFKQYYFDGSYQGAQEMATVEVSENGGTSYTVVQQLAGAAGWADVTLDLSAYAGKNIMVGFRYNDGGGWTYGLGIDDVVIYEPAAIDYSLSSIDLPTYHSLANGSVEIKGNVVNNAGEAITSMDVEYTVDGGAPVSGTLTGLNIAPLDNYDFTHPTNWNPGAEGKYNVVVTITGVNGGSDADASDNSASKEVDVFSNAYDRTVLYETFTSSTCGPCVAGNANFKGIVADIPSNEYASIKYQMSWPGTGDPYNTADGNDRRNFYGVSSVPNMQIDGGWDGNSGSFTRALHDEARQVPAFASIWAEYHVDAGSKTVTTCATVEAMKDLGAATLHMAIKEMETYNNTGTNGETEFQDVLKKMAPTSSGTAVTITTGMKEKVCVAYSFNGSYRLPNSANDLINDATEHSVEDFDDLGVVVWLQDASLNVLNATNAVSTPLSVDNVDSQNNAISVYPNPAVERAIVSINAVETSVAQVRVINIVGSTVMDMNNVQLSQGANLVDVNTTDLVDGVYFVQVTINGEVSTSQMVVQK